MDRLPNEVLFIIIEKLDWKTMVGARGVSSLWDSIIKSHIQTTQEISLETELRLQKFVYDFRNAPDHPFRNFRFRNFSLLNTSLLGDFEMVFGNKVKKLHLLPTVSDDKLNTSSKYSRIASQLFHSYLTLNLGELILESSLDDVDRLPVSFPHLRNMVIRQGSFGGAGSVELESFSSRVPTIKCFSISCSGSALVSAESLKIFPLVLRNLAGTRGSIHLLGTNLSSASVPLMAQSMLQGTLTTPANITQMSLNISNNVESEYTDDQFQGMTSKWIHFFGKKITSLQISSDGDWNPFYGSGNPIPILPSLGEVQLSFVDFRNVCPSRFPHLFKMTLVCPMQDMNTAYTWNKVTQLEMSFCLTRTAPPRQLGLSFPNVEILKVSGCVEIGFVFGFKRVTNLILQGVFPRKWTTFTGLDKKLTPKEILTSAPLPAVNNDNKGDNFGKDHVYHLKDLKLLKRLTIGNDVLKPLVYLSKTGELRRLKEIVMWPASCSNIRCGKFQTCPRCTVRPQFFKELSLHHDSVKLN